MFTPRARATRRFVLTFLVVTANLFGLQAGSAAAANIASPSTVVLDGPVESMVFDGSGRLYMGGSFEYVGPRLGHGLVLTSASATPAALPDINGPVLAAVSDGAGGTFIGGSFTSVGGVTRHRLAHVRADHTLDPDWNPGASNTVRALAYSATDNAVFAGGDFTGATAIGGVGNARLAKLAATGNGTVDTNWVPGGFPQGSVRALLLSGSTLYVGGTSGLLVRVSTTGAGTPDISWDPVPQGAYVSALALSGTDLYVGGLFSSIGGQARANLAKIPTTGNGSADATWDPGTIGAGQDGEVRALLVSGADLFVGGPFAGAGGQVLPRLAKLATTGTGAADATWTLGLANGAVNSLALAGGDLIVGGQFFGIGSEPARANMAKVTTTGTGSVTSWNPNVNGGVRALSVSASDIFAGGDFSSAGPNNEKRGGLIRLNPNGSLDTSWTPDVQGYVNDIALDGTSVYAGGSFGRAGGQTRVNLVKLSTSGAGTADATWAPNPILPVTALALSGSDMFVAGMFVGPDSIGGQARDRIAKVSTTGAGAADPTWNPGADGIINALTVSGTDLFAGGFFSLIGGQLLFNIAKLPTTGTGAADATWAPNIGGTVDALLVSGSALFVGGSFTGAGPLRIAKLSTSGVGTADPAWDPGANAPVTALALTGDNLYAGGVFSSIGGQPRNQLARLSASTGTVDAGFQPAASLNAGGVRSIAATPTRVFAGGFFQNSGPLSTAGLALFDFNGPTASLTTPAEGARYRQGDSIAAAFSCADPDGPLDSVTCTGNVPAGSAIDTSSPGTKTFTVTATDTNSNTASKSVSYTVDGSAPAITIASPEDGASYVVGTRVSVVFTCTDPDDAVASCTGTAPSGSPLVTSSAGKRTFTVTAADTVGNTATKTVTYKVVNPLAPVIDALKITPAAFRAAPKGATTSKQKKAPIGGRVSFKLSTAATVTFEVTRKSRKKSVTVGSFTFRGKTGANKFKFRGRLKDKALKVGSYRLVAQAKGPTGLTSKRVAKPFKIVKR